MQSRHALHLPRPIAKLSVTIAALVGGRDREGSDLRDVMT
jgi:hypothetical protein